MKKPLTALLVVIIVLFIAYRDGLFSSALKQEPAGRAGTEDNKTLNAYIDQLENVRFDDHGNPVSRLRTAAARQTAGQSSIALQNPVFNIGSGNRQWFGQAHTGSIDSDNSILILEHDVIFHQAANAAKIHTEKLVIDQPHKRAHTDTAVEISAAHSKTTARGMQLDFDAQTIQLQGDVHTSYYPDQHDSPADTGADNQ